MTAQTSELIAFPYLFNARHEMIKEATDDQDRRLKTMQKSQ